MQYIPDMRIHCRRRPDGVFLFPERDKVRTGAMDDARGVRKTKNITWCPRDCILRPKAVIGCRCPVSGMPRKPIFTLDNSGQTVLSPY
jgi:hypothetical protein